MTDQEYYLIQLMEECAEVQHTIGKMLRFGITDTNPKTGENNVHRLQQELHDLYVAGLLVGEYLPFMVTWEPEPNVVAARKEKVRKWKEYAANRQKDKAWNYGE